MTCALDAPHYNCAVTLPSGPRVSYAVVGDPNGRPVLCFLGMRGHRYFTYLYQGLARKHKIRLFGIDRPGYGLSDPLTAGDATPAPLAFAHRVAELVNVLGIAEFGLVGGSAGAMFAMAIAADGRLAPRIVSPVVLVAPWVGTNAAACPWLLKAASWLPQPAISRCVQLVLGSMNVSMTHLNGSHTVRILSNVEASADPLLMDELCARINAEPNNVDYDAQLGLGKDPRGYGVPLSDVRVPIYVIHAELDALVPLQAAQELVASVPMGMLKVVPGATHSLLPFDDDTMDHVFGRVGAKTTFRRSSL